MGILLSRSHAFLSLWILRQSRVSHCEWSKRHFEIQFGHPEHSDWDADWNGISIQLQMWLGSDLQKSHFMLYFCPDCLESIWICQKNKKKQTWLAVWTRAAYENGINLYDNNQQDRGLSLNWGFTSITLCSQAQKDNVLWDYIVTEVAVKEWIAFLFLASQLPRNDSFHYQNLSHLVRFVKHSRAAPLNFKLLFTFQVSRGLNLKLASRSAGVRDVQSIWAAQHRSSEKIQVSASRKSNFFWRAEWMGLCHQRCIQVCFIRSTFPQYVHQVV